MKLSRLWLCFIVILLSACSATAPLESTQPSLATNTPLSPTSTALATETPALPPTSTLPPTVNANPFTDLSAELHFPGPAFFHFTYTGEPTDFAIRISTDSAMAANVYDNFAIGTTGSLMQETPTHWERYICGETLYWRVMTDGLKNSPVESAVVDCSYTAEGDPGYWAHTYMGNVPFTVHTILETQEGGLLISGTTLGPNDHDFDNVLVKLNPDGRVGWQRVFPPTFSVLTLKETELGHVLLTGTYGYKTLTGDWVSQNSGLFFIVELSPTGEIVRQETYSVSGLSIGQVLQEPDGVEEIYAMNYRYKIVPETSDNRMLEVAVMPNGGGAILAGPHWGVIGASDGGLYPALLGFWAFRVDQTGQILWQKFFEGAMPPYMQGLATQDQGVILSGKKYNGKMLTWIVKFDAQGNTVFWKFFTFDAAGISETPDGGVLLWQRNYTRSSTGEDDYIFRVLKTNALGELVWTRNYEGVEAEYIYERSTGGFVLTGMNNDLPMVITLDERGNLPECDLVHYVEGSITLETPILPRNVSGATTISSTEYRTPEEIDPTPPLVITNTQLIAQDLCQYSLPPEITATPLPPTPEATSIQAGQLYPILVGEEGYLLGGIQNGQWLDANTTSSLITGQETYALYDSTGLYQGMAAGKTPLPTSLATCQAVHLEHPPLPVTLALPGFWPLAPRTATSQPPSQLYLDAATTFLEEHGYTAEEIELTHVMRVDLQGDGGEEVLLRILWTENQVTHALLLLRQLVGNTVTTTPLATETDLPSANHEWLTFADLNNDGAMEILTKTLIENVQRLRTWEIHNFLPEIVLETDCPLP